MECAVCNHKWCWVCGLDPYNQFHKIQFGEGLLCEMINSITIGDGFLHWSIRWLLTILGIVTAPVVMFFLMIIAIPIEISQ